MLKYVISTIFLFIATAIFAQDADSLVMENPDTLQSVIKADSCKNRRVSPTHTLGQVSVIDTLATPNSAISILLFNDNTWRYLLAEDFRNDTTIYNDHWNTSVANPYTDVELSSFAEATPIRLVDSLQSYHYPYIGRITSRYGPRRGRQHQGIDMALKVGDPIYATFDGKVRLSKAAGNYGNLVIIRHCNGLETYYAHLSERSVQSGDWVVAGQQIGLGGNTGRSTGPHLHYEVRYRGQSFDPERIIDFKTGELRRAELLLKKRHFSIYAKFDQNFDDEIEIEKQEEAERKAAAAIQYHTVRSGDTLGAIARKYGTTVTRICQLNGIKSTSILRIGQRLRVR
ncbi:MAG: peptidoglycan DD-metalloendopeptidase family protein [Alistipes sp.]|nr:peptidoglycan DD-metalloendopeptidase family protein [Alistipes sp.]